MYIYIYRYIPHFLIFYGKYRLKIYAIKKKTEQRRRDTESAQFQVLEPQEQMQVLEHQPRGRRCRF